MRRGQALVAGHDWVATIKCAGRCQAGCDSSALRASYQYRGNSRITNSNQTHYGTTQSSLSSTVLADSSPRCNHRNKSW